MRAAETAPALSRAAVVVMAAVGVLAVLAYVPLFIRASAAHPSVFGFPGATVLSVVAFIATGVLVALGQRRNPLGWLMLVAGVLLMISGDAQLYAVLAYRGGETLWAAPAAVWVGSTLWGPAFAFLPIGMLLFPDGRLGSRFWRWALAAVILLDSTFTVALMAFVTGTIHQGPVRIGTDGQIAALTGTVPKTLLGSLFVTSFTLLIATFAIAVAGLIRNTVAARGERRAQMKWFMYATAVATAAFAAYAVAQVTTGASGITHSLSGVFVLAISTIPAATAVAIFKYRLYGIDVVISRTLVYGALAALITGVYVAIAVGVGVVWTGGKPNLGLSILATAIVAVGFQPARERLQRVANRLVYGRRATPYQVLSAFSSQVAGAYVADEVLPRMARVLQQGTGAAGTAVWLRVGAALTPVAAWPDAAIADLPESAPFDGALPELPGVTRAVQVRYQGEVLGALTVVKRRGDSFTPVEEKLLDDLAHQAGLVLKNVGLTADLQRRLEELRASRQRLVSAQDAERRRLERNLHDGAQQHLVAIKVQLGLAETLATRDPEQTQKAIAQLKSAADDALEALRDLARGVYPPLLAANGLAAALEAHARKATLPVTVEAEGTARYQQEVEGTVYFCVLEALQNVQKYANASRASVRLHQEDGTIRFVVEDDGRGFDVTHVRRGAGLTNIEDRLDAIGGRLDVRSSPRQGCTLTGTVPIPVPAGACA